jgi:hypothetical protein
MVVLGLGSPAFGKPMTIGEWRDKCRHPADKETALACGLSSAYVDAVLVWHKENPPTPRGGTQARSLADLHSAFLRWADANRQHWSEAVSQGLVYMLRAKAGCLLD